VELATQSFVFMLLANLPMTLLTLENYQQGFLVDEECLAGVTEDPKNPKSYIAFVLQHTTGEYLHYLTFSDLSSALGAIHQIQRPWTFEQLGGGCGGCGGNGSAGGGCSGGNCKKGGCGKGKCEKKS